LTGDKYYILSRSGGASRLRGMRRRWVGSAKRTLPARAPRGLASEISIRIFLEVSSDFVQEGQPPHRKTALKGGF